MNPRHRASRAAIDLLKRFEGYRPRAARLPDGRWIIGHGHTQTAREGAEVSAADAEALLLYDLIAVSQALNDGVYSPLTQNQFDALCSFAFNIGLDNFRSASVLRRLNEGSHLQAACAMELWRKAEVGGEVIVVDALVRRRAAEKALFLTPQDGAWTPAPSALLRPLLDPQAGQLVPSEAPAPVLAELDGEELTAVRQDAAAIPDEPAASPVVAAAEAVQARLETLFPDEDAARPQADFAPPIDLSLDIPSPPEIEASPAPEAAEPAPEPASEPAPPEVLEELPDVEETEPLAVLDDEAPYHFREPIVAPVKARSQVAGVASFLTLALIGLAFFAGGLFWGLNATSTSLDNYVTPRMVGVLAAATGIFMFGIAVFQLLLRLGRDAEGEDGLG